MRTIELIIPVDDDRQEFLIAELSDLDFDAFVQEDDRLRAYVPAPRWNDVHRERIEQWLRVHGIHQPLEERVVEEKNWNAAWERTVQPQAVGPFVIRPTWAETPPAHAGKLLLEIDPKMSFGTGIHASTRLVLRFLPDLVAKGARVLDAGTGTGILAIAALRLGAAEAVAFDNSEWAQQNAIENFLLNGVGERTTFYPGTLGAVSEGGFDLILANIQLDVLKELLPALTQKMTSGGAIALSGLLRSHRAPMLEAAAALGLAPAAEAEEGEWWAVVLRTANGE